MPNNKQLKIGVTGGIGSGKTVVCQVFKTLGIPVYNADIQAKVLMTKDKDVKTAIRNNFGDMAYFRDGSLNTDYLSLHVFKQKDLLKILNSIVHPAVGRDFDSWVLNQAGKPYIIKEAALLVEAGSYKSLDHLITVTAPADLKIDRVLKRDKHRTKSDVENIMSNQLDDKEKIAKSKFVIKNDGKTLIVPQVLKIHDYLISLR
jgi:dephospho-CoA kinase